MFSKSKPLLSMYEWCQIIGLSPWLVSQVGEPNTVLLTEGKSCERVFYQSPFQSSEALTREDVAEALIQAENLVAGKCLNYFPAPKFRQEPIDYPRPSNLELGNLWYGRSGRLKSIETDYKRIITVGTYVNTEVEADVAITGSDPYSDGFDTLWSMSVPVVAGTTAEQIHVYFSSADRVGDLTLAECEIYPVNVTISGNTATITGHMTQVITPVHFYKLAPDKLNATDAIYATTLDVYRRTIDLSESGTLVWNVGEYVVGLCNDPPCQVTMSSACFVATDARSGKIAPIPATYDEDTANYTRLYPEVLFAPDNVIVNYVSGIPKVNGRMASPFNRAVALLATALLPNRNCGCERADLRLSYYRDIPTDDKGNLRVDPSVITLSSKLFGVSGRGAIQALELLSDQAIPEYRSAHA